jgi:tRNA pseudouridine32 synthase/23S rRNA pseudouridine746 synthase
MKNFEKHIPIVNDGLNPMTALGEHCNLSKAQIKDAITKGALWLTKGKSTQRLRRLKKTLNKGDELHFYYNETVINQVPPEALLIEDMQDYSVWYKPYNMLSQGSKWSDHCTVARWAQTHLTPERPAFIVHRLDRAATGLIIVAHTKKAAQYFSKMFEQHNLEKHYVILVHGNHTQRQQPDVIDTNVDSKTALSTFTCVEYNKTHDVSLVNVKIDSGRKHQIRIHSASIGMPVVGDRLHGNVKLDDVLNTMSKNTALDLQLCAFSLSFHCPVTNNTKIFTLPKHLRPSLDVFSKV